ncbi:MAG: hypothetical protein NTZ52_06555 [Chlamydiae bacterium]|nr:hypothetical protein [Chlamydiota bacterium]
MDNQAYTYPTALVYLVVFLKIPALSDLCHAKPMTYIDQYSISILDLHINTV